MRVNVALLLVWSVSWVLPVVSIEGAEAALPAASVASGLLSGFAEAMDDPGLDLAALMSRMSEDGVVVGHEAARFVWQVLVVDVDRGAKVPDIARSAWWNLASPLFVLGLLLGAVRWHRAASVVATLAAASACWWIFEDDLGEDLRVGYWLWLGSMGVAAVWAWWCRFAASPVRPAKP